MKGMIYAALIAATTTAVLSAPTAQADDGDGPFLQCLARGWGFPSTDVYASLRLGHQIRDAIEFDGMAPVAVRDYIYLHTDLPTVARANVMVNCATSVYLGFGPPLM